MHDLECCLGDIVDGRNNKERQPEAARAWILAIRTYKVAVSRDEKDNKKADANPSKIQIRFNVTVMCLVGMEVVLTPQVREPRPYPKAFESGPEPWIEVHPEQIGPDVGAPCEGRVSSQRLDGECVGVLEDVTQQRNAGHRRHDGVQPRRRLALLSNGEKYQHASQEKARD